MGFLAPFLVGFTALASIPIVIHLLNRSRFRVLKWAAMEFLLKTLRQNARRLQLKDLLLLILRTLAIILAALALARPTLSSTALAGLAPLAGGVEAAIVLDVSMSMQVRDSADTRFERAQAAAKALVNGLPRGSKASLILMSGLAEAEVAEPSSELAFVAESVQKAQCTDGGTDVAAALAKAWAGLKERKTARKEIHLVTDLQANAWPPADDPSWKKLLADLDADPECVLHIVDVAEKTEGNVAIDSFQPVDPVVGTDAPAAFHVVLRRWGTADPGPVEVELRVDDAKTGEMRKVASQVVPHLAASETVRLEAVFKEGGRRRIEARISADRLAADNARALVVDVSDRLKVLVVDGNPASKAAVFLRACLSPASMQRIAAGSPLPTDQTPQEPFSFELLAPQALAAAAVDGYQVIILADVGELQPAVADAIAQSVLGGKGLLVLPGAKVDGPRLNALLGKVLPARLESPRALLGEGEGVQREAGIGLATTGLVHPIVSFFAPPDLQAFLAKPRFKRAHQLEPVEGAVPVLRFADGQPALVEKAAGRGKVLLAAFPVDKTWTNLPLCSAFLMLARRSVQHLALGERTPQAVLVHEPLSVPIPVRDAGERFTLADPRGGAQRHPVPSQGGATASVPVGDLPFAGFWRLSGGTVKVDLAVQPPGDESQLDLLDKPALEERLKDMKRWWLGSGDDPKAGEKGRTGIEIWPLLLALAIACLLAESWLALLWAPRGT